jgi:hypothetical protein
MTSPHSRSSHVGVTVFAGRRGPTGRHRRTPGTKRPARAGLATDLIAAMLPSLLFVAGLTYTAWSEWWI